MDVAALRTTDTSQATDPLVGLGGRVVRNLAILSVSQVAGMVMSVITVGILSRALSLTEFGAFNYAFAFLSVGLVLADLGLSTTLLRDAAQDSDKEATLIQRAIGLKLVMAAVIVALSWAGAFFYLEESVRTACLIISAIIPLQALSLTGVVLQARVQVKRGVVAELANRLPGFVFMLAALWMGWGLAGVMTSLVVGEVTGFLAITAMTRAVVWPRPRIDVAVWRTLARASLTIGGVSILSVVVSRIDFVMLGQFGSLEDVGYYGAAYRLPQLLERLPMLAMVTLFPLMARLAKDDRRGLRDVYRWSVTRAAAVAAPALLVVVVAAPWILTWWQGVDYLPAVPALRWLLAATLCSCLAVIAGNVLIVIEQARSLLVIWAVAAPVNALLNWFWIADYGATGAAAAGCVTGAVVLVLSLAVVERHLAVCINEPVSG
jgi:O-antigen/teichoic acid export membrane protein